MDIAERLRIAAPISVQRAMGSDLLDAAADEIERLRAALKPFAECIWEASVFVGNPDAPEVEVGNFANLRFRDFVRARQVLGLPVEQAYEQSAAHGEKG